MRARGVLLSLLGLALLVSLGFLLKLSSSRTEASGAPVARSEPRSTEPRAVESPPSPAARSDRQAAVPATAAADTGLTVRVVDEHDHPLAGARVVLFDSSTPMLRRELPPALFGDAFIRAWRESTTDAAGSARFTEPNADQRDLLILSVDHLPVYERRDPRAAVVSVIIERATTLRGAVVVDGAAPTEPIALEVRCFPDPASEWGAGVRGLLHSLERAADRLTISTAADGTFAVRGLSRARPTMVTAPPCFVNSDGGAPRVEVPADVDHVTLVLSRARSVVVRARTRPGSAMADQRFALEARLIDRAGGTVETVHTALSFANPVTLPTSPEVSTLDLTVRDAETGRWLARREELRPARDEAIVLDVPELEHTLVLQVQDSLGDPIADATARGGEHEWRSTTTDGRLVLDMLVDLPALTVGAPGHAAVNVPLPLPLPERLTVTLQRPTIVRLDVIGLDPSIATRLGVHVGNPSHEAYPRERLTGSPPSALDANGQWRADDLPADVSLTLSLQDAYGFELQSFSVELEPGEERRLRCTVASVPRDVVLRVTDAGGAPVEGAAVRVARLSLWFVDEGDARTDADGRATLRGVFAPDPEIEVLHDRMSTRRLPLSAACAADVRLYPSRTLAVQVRGPAISAARDLDVRLAIAGDPQSPYRAMHQFAGIHLFENVPRRAGVVFAPNRDGEATVEPDTTEVILVLQP